MAKKDSAYSLRICGVAHGGDVSYEPLMETQQAFKGSWATSGGGWPSQGTVSAKAAAVSCSAAVVAQRALLASGRRRVGGGRRMAGGGTKSTVPSRLSKVSAAEDVAS